MLAIVIMCISTLTCGYVQEPSKALVLYPRDGDQCSLEDQKASAVYCPA